MAFELCVVEEAAKILETEALMVVFSLYFDFLRFCYVDASSSIVIF